MKHFCLLLLSILVIGCSSTNANPTAETTIMTRQTITFSGSGGGSAILEATLKSWDNTDYELQFLSGSGGTAAKQAVVEGSLDIAILLSKAIESETLDGTIILPLGNDPLIFATHQAVTIDSLSIGQLRDIYAGKITNWQQVGGANAEIRVLVRNADEDSTELLQEVVFNNMNFPETVTILTKASEMRDALESIPNSIGFLSYGDFLVNQVSAKVLSIDNIPPQAYAEGKYKLPARTLAIVYTPTTATKIKPLLDFMTSIQAQQTLTSYGLIIP